MIDVDIAIFDWSGTISDDMNVAIDASNRILGRLGVKTKITKEYMRKNYKPDYMDFYKVLGVNEERAKISRMYREEFLRSRIKPKIMDNAKDILEWPNSSGKKLFVISSHPPELLDKESNDYGINNIVTKFYADSIKKENDINKILEVCMVEPKKVIFVGDTFVDIDAGKAAGVKTVAVLSGYQDEKTLRKCSPDFLIKDVGGLEKIISQ